MRRRQSRRACTFEVLEQRLALATYYVATSGSNSGDGSAGSPWLTLQHAAGRVSAGDQVIVHPGNYAGFDLRRDGTATNPIRFSAEPGVVIDSENSRTPDGINLEGADYVVIEGFTVIGVERAGIRSVTNTGVVIRSNRCDANGRWGILTGFSENILIENNECSRSAIEHGIYVSNSADNPIVRGNRSWGNRGNGIHMNGDINTGNGDGIISGALVEGNVIYDNGRGGGSGINCDGVQDSVIQNNLLYNNHASGISLYRIDGGGGSTGNLVINNTVVQASDGRWALNIRDGSTTNTVLNNIFYNHHSFRGSISVSADSLSGLVSDHNAVMNRFSVDGGGSVISLAQWRAATQQDSSSLLSTPAALFVDPATSDFHLKQESPAVDAGTSNQAPAVDFERGPRPQGARIDIGADEQTAGFVGTTGNDTVYVRANTTGTMLELFVSVSGQPAFTWPIAATEALVIDTSAGDDQLVVELSGVTGPPGGIRFLAGGGSNQLSVTGGQVRIDSFADGGTLATTVSGGAHLTTARLNLTGLTLGGAGTKVTIQPDGALANVLESLVMDATSTLDLTNNDLILRATAANKDAIHADLQTKITSAQNGVDANFVTNWNGPGITSSAARTSNVAAGFDLTALGVIRNSDLDITAGVPGSSHTSFGGVPVYADDVLVKYTYTGDGNLDGAVTFDDYAAMDSAFFGLIPNLGWATGDIDFDSAINFDDYSVVDQAFFFQGAPLAARRRISIPAFD
jgi:parallel beta-helix repeat protein